MSSPSKRRRLVPEEGHKSPTISSSNSTDNEDDLLQKFKEHLEVFKKQPVICEDDSSCSVQAGERGHFHSVSNSYISALCINNNSNDSIAEDLAMRVSRELQQKIEDGADEDRRRVERDYKFVLEDNVRNIFTLLQNCSQNVPEDNSDPHSLSISQDTKLSLNSNVEALHFNNFSERDERGISSFENTDLNCDDANSNEQQAFYIFGEAAEFQNTLFRDELFSAGSSEQDSSSNESSLSTGSNLSENHDNIELGIFDLNLCREDGSESDLDFDEDFDLAQPVENVATLQAMKWNKIKLFEGSSLTQKGGLKNKESKSGLDRILKTISMLLPSKHKLPCSSFRIISLLEGLAPDLSFTKHYFCKSCSLYLLSSDIPCPICNNNASSESENSEAPNVNKVGEFFIFDIEKIIQYWFHKRSLASKIEHLKINNDGTLSDIQDGSIYKSLNQNGSKYDVNLILGIDGVKIRKGSFKECWLVMTTPVEVPIHQREAFTTVVGIWYNNEKPKNMNTFLKPFCEKIKMVNESGGVEWRHPETKESCQSKINIPGTVADAPARAKIQNLMLHNSINGCNTCEISQVKSAPIPLKKRKRVYKYKNNLTLRNKETMLLQASEATRTGNPVKGVRGPSIFSILPNFDISTCVFPEYMHSVLLGVTKQMIKQWLDNPGAWNIKNRMPAIDKILRNIQHPDFVHRSSRTLEYLSAWKASDYYYFLLYESLPVLDNILPEEFFQHLILLVRSIFQLLKRRVSAFDINEADMLLKLFVVKFGRLYGDRTMSYNVHQLCHLALCVERFGPLYCSSAFPFEGLNGTIAHATHGSNSVGQEIVNNLKIYHGIERLRMISEQGDDSVLDIRTFCPGEVLGRCKEIQFSPEEANLLGQYEEVLVYSRARIGYDVYTSETHKKLKTANFYVKWEVNGATQYGSIRFFLVKDDEFSVCVRIFNIDHLSVLYNHETTKSVTHLIPVTVSDRITLISSKDILSSFVKVGKVKNFIFVRPNLIRSVL
ncbi:putative E3 ubiquitin-protein ligase rnf113 [Frankliniella fusca]|uniref:E3 ubiquitin-protein ligase rnf113 n=1 Tax=Frankliniella fusca TaxID=407009 RepID=A0AAE1H6A8_9NEOP|nr:putative E3 ubiquitin-protein ligase rnf113 [Frankliniella fusca]